MNQKKYSYAFLTLLLAILTCNAKAEWGMFADPDEFTHYLDDRKTRTGNLSKIWELTDYNTPQTGAGGKMYWSEKMQTEFNCVDKQRRVLYSSIHAEKMGEGKPIHEDLSPGKWESVAPESTYKYILDFACR